MTRITSIGIIIIEKTAPGICEYCGAKKELRPYGKNGANICYDCGMKNEPETRKQANKFFDKAIKQTVGKN